MTERGDLIDSEALFVSHPDLPRATFYSWLRRGKLTVHKRDRKRRRVWVSLNEFRIVYSKWSGCACSSRRRGA